MTNEETPADVIAQEVAGGAEEAEDRFRRRKRQLPTYRDRDHAQRYSLKSQLIKGGIMHSGIPSIPQLLGRNHARAKWTKAIEHQWADAIMGILLIATQRLPHSGWDTTAGMVESDRPAGGL